MKNAECQNQKAEENSSSSLSAQKKTSPLLLYYYIIIYTQKKKFSPEIDEKKIFSSCISGEKADQSRMTKMMENA